MPITEQVLVEFTADTSQLQPAEDKLTNFGKIDQKSAVIFKATNDELRNRNQLTGQLTLNVTKEQAVVNKLVASVKNLSGESRKAVENLLKLSTGEIAAGFDKAVVSVDDYISTLKQAEGQTGSTEKASNSLRQRLKDLTQQLASLKLEGKDNTAQFVTLAKEAGHIKDAIQDAGQEIRNFASDTKTIDTVVGSVQTLAGGFAVVQGAAGLFGDQSKDLQETLLKVNSAMALTQGLQQVSNALQKEGAVSLLVINIQQKIRNAQLIIENALQSESVVVRTLATVAQKALNAAMAANPIGIVIVALTSLIGIFEIYASRVRSAAKEQADLNIAIFDATSGLNAEIEGLKRSNAQRVSALESSGARQSEIMKQNLITQIAIENARYKEVVKLDKLIEDNRNKTEESAIEAVNIATKRRDELEDDSAAARIDLEVKNNERLRQLTLENVQDIVDIKQGELDKLLAIGGKNTAKEFELRKQLARAQADAEVKNAGDNAAKIFAARNKLAKELHDLDVASREQAQKEILAGLNTQLIKAQNFSRAINQRTSQEEIDAQKRIILATAKFESEQEGLSQKQRTEIRLKGIQEAAQLQREFDKKSIEETLQDFISVNNAELQKINLSEKEKLNLKIDNIIAAAEIELKQNEGISAKIKEINAKRDADIKAARLQSLQETLSFELKSFEIEFAAENRKIEKLLTGQDAIRSASNNKDKARIAEQLGIKKLSLQEEISLIDEQEQHAIEGINKQKAALRQANKENLISGKDFQQQYDKLIDDGNKVVEDAEQKKRDASKKTFEEQKKQSQEMALLLLDLSSQVGSTLFQVFQANLDSQEQKISSQRRQIDELRQAGAITEKESIERLRKVDIEERKLKREQAKKDKELAVFNAVISTAQAVIKAYATTGPIAGPVLAAIVGAIGAAQIDFIAARKIPQFGKGKKDSYQGLGRIGETGAELLETNGKMYVAKKESIVWLNKTDKVYNPSETRAILNRAIPSVNKIIVNGDKTAPGGFDYDRLGKAIGKHTSMQLNIDGYRDFLLSQQSFTTYLNNRRGY